MAIALPQQIYNQFKGIREVNGTNSGGAISALSAKNVEFFNSDIGSGTGIRSVVGSKVFATLPTGYKAIKCFSSVQDGVEYLFVYAENTTAGVLYSFDAQGTRTEQITNLPLTGQANGLTMQLGDYDVFIFTNGKAAYSVCFTSDVAYGDNIKAISTQANPAQDNQNRNIFWLSMTAWNGFLVVASDYGVHASHKNDIYTWDDVVQSSTAAVDSWYLDFGKKVTAVTAFATGLFIFTEEDISHIGGSPNLSTSNLASVAMNGCYSYESLVSHGTYLFFYDDKQKNIFYIQQTDTGQTRPTGPVAVEVQSFFDGKTDRFKMYSCIYSTYNEIWLIINDKTLIFDYTQQEFIERQQTEINDICMYGNRIYSVNEDGEIRQEKVEAGTNEYYPVTYQTSIINMGSNTNLKKQKTPLLLVLNSNHVNDFFVEIMADYKTKNPKHIVYKVGHQGVYADPEAEEYSVINLYGDDSSDNPDNWVPNAYFADDSLLKKSVVEISTPQTWYTLSIKIYTEQAGQGFSIESVELKRLKEKTKTKGR